MPKREAALKSALHREISKHLPSFVVLPHEDVRSSGIPDWSVNGNHHTSWLEFKHATPRFSTQEHQELMCCRLDVSAFLCRYIVWFEDSIGADKRTCIIRPLDVLRKKGHVREMAVESWAPGYNHRWVCQYLNQVHHS